MKTRIVTVLVLLPALIVSMTLPAHAIFGSIIAGIQRAQMIVNQGLQIYEQQIAKLTMDGQLLQLTDQFGHLQDQALGAVGEITDPFTTMASQPTRMIGTALAWKNAFTGSAAEIANGIEAMASGTSLTQTWQGRLVAADTVTETEVLNLFAPLGTGRGAAATEAYRAGREQADERLVLSFATSDAATELLRAAEQAATAYQDMAARTNLSNTALQQQLVAGAITEGNLDAAIAQMGAVEAARRNAEELETEIERREALARWVAAQQRAQATFNAHQAGIAAHSDAMREGLAWRPLNLYGGP